MPIRKQLVTKTYDMAYCNQAHRAVCVGIFPPFSSLSFFSVETT